MAARHSEYYLALTGAAARSVRSRRFSLMHRAKTSMALAMGPWFRSDSLLENVIVFLTVPTLTHIHASAEVKGL